MYLVLSYAGELVWLDACSEDSRRETSLHAGWAFIPGSAGVQDIIWYYDMYYVLWYYMMLRHQYRVQDSRYFHVIIDLNIDYIWISLYSYPNCYPRICLYVFSTNRAFAIMIEFRWGTRCRVWSMWMCKSQSNNTIRNVFKSSVICMLGLVHGFSRATIYNYENIVRESVCVSVVWICDRHCCPSLVSACMLGSMNVSSFS